ncbi:hypothetical protein [Flindersiella endophytica]
MQWFEVSCGLPNIARTLASLSAYVAAADADGLQIHQYVDADLRTNFPDGRPVGLTVSTGHPEEGTVTVRITETDGRSWTLSLRVPQWVTGAVLSVPGERTSRPRQAAGWQFSDRSQSARKFGLCYRCNRDGLTPTHGSTPCVAAWWPNEDRLCCVRRRLAMMRTS